MGTHSLIIMREQREDGTFVIYAVLYQQYDGYPDGVGKDLLNFLNVMNIVNGFGRHDVGHKVANGSGDLFAQIIGLFKKEVGGAYLHAPTDEDLEEWNKRSFLSQWRKKDNFM